MIYFVYEVVPSDNSSTAGKIFASCWINLNDQSLAEGRAVKFIREQGYAPVERIDAYPIVRGDYEKSSEGLEYFEQALIDDEVMVLFMSEGEEEEAEITCEN